MRAPSRKGEAPRLEELAGDEGWAPIRRFNEGRSADSYVSGEPQGSRLRIRYFRRQTDDALVARAWFGPGTQGPPGHAHGGATAALLDEAMGFCCWLAGHRVVAVSIQVDFRKMVPVGAVATLEAAVERVDRRKVYPSARLYLPGGELAAQSSGIFLELAREHLDELAGHAARAGMDPEPFA